MTSHNLGIISEHLEQLQGHAYFRPEAGPLKETLTEAVLEALPGEVLEGLSERSFDLEVSIGRQEGDREVAVDFSVDDPELAYTSEIALTALTDAALEDLSGYLARLIKDAASTETAGDSDTVLRKNIETSDSHEQAAASARLKVSPQWLKSVIPCTDYSYDEIDGKKIIREYYWSKELIEKLFRIKCTKTTPEDLQYVAKECCEGDVEWARDLIARLKSPNRAERPPKEQQPQPQKNQARTPAKAAPNERPRSRSRHKRPLRQGASDAARKPESAAAPKTPPAK